MDVVSGIVALASWVKVAVLVKKLRCLLICKLDGLVFRCQDQNTFAKVAEHRLIVFYIANALLLVFLSLGSIADRHADKCHKEETHANVVELVENGGDCVRFMRVDQGSDAEFYHTQDQG